MDWLRVFWTLKHSFRRTFIESFKTLFTAARDCGSDYHRQLGQLVYVLDIRPSTLPGGWLDSRVVSVLDSGAEGTGSNRSRDAVG